MSVPLGDPVAEIREALELGDKLKEGQCFTDKFSRALAALAVIEAALDEAVTRAAANAYAAFEATKRAETAEATVARQVETLRAADEWLAGLAESYAATEPEPKP